MVKVALLLPLVLVLVLVLAIVVVAVAAAVAVALVVMQSPPHKRKVRKLPLRQTQESPVLLAPIYPRTSRRKLLTRREKLLLPSKLGTMAAWQCWLPSCTRW